ncbi:MAG: FAD-dependent oxidoreductase [Sphingomonadales bacterium]|nr:FAD-dependent oxidoreductase [Sphingomonadales bacterium]
MTMHTPAPRITIVGASLAGLRTAEAVAGVLPGARITLIGDEGAAPYNRPPLSKDALESLARGRETAAAVLERLALRSKLGDRAELRLGQAAVALEGTTVRLADGTAIPGDRVIAATGLRPRRLALTGAEGRRHVLRSFADLRALAADLRPGARLVVIGGGFIGCEIAATARKLGLSVRLVEPAPQPMLRALGPRVAAAMAALHRVQGVDLYLGRSVAGFGAAQVVLDDGQALEADVIVEALGSHPNVEWLAGSGADLTDGVLVDDHLCAPGAPGLMAEGDVARFANPLFDATPRRTEHWCIPGQTARRVAEVLAAEAAGSPPPERFAPLPSFWSDQHGLRLQAFGAPTLADATRVVEGDLGLTGTAPVIVEYLREGRPVGVLGLGANPAALARHRAHLETSLARSLAEADPATPAV